MRNNPISQVLPVLNDQLDTLQATLDHDLQQETSSVKQEVRLVIRELRNIDIATLDLPSVQANLSILHQLTVRFSPTLELKKCTMKDDNTRMHDLAAAYRREQSEHQFPRILSDYPGIVKQVEKVRPVFSSISESIDEIRELSVALYKRQAELAQPPVRPPVEEKVPIPFGQVVYPVTAQCFWLIFRNSALQKNDLNLHDLFESGQLASPRSRTARLQPFQPAMDGLLSVS